jgi:hypothetical protein
MNQHCRTKTKQSLHMLSYIRTYQANLPAPKNWYNPASRFRNYKQTYHASTVVHTTLLLDSETTSKPDGNSEHTLADSNKDTILGEILWQHADIPEFQRFKPALLLGIAIFIFIVKNCSMFIITNVLQLSFIFF